MNSGVYQILNVTTNKRYIGSSKNIVKRLKDHIKSLHSGKHHSILLQRAWNKCCMSVNLSGLLSSLV